VILVAFIGTLMVLIATSVQAQGLILEAEVLEGAADIALPGLNHDQVRYVILHHKHQKDQASLAAWLRRHGGTRVSFQTLDGTVHQAVLQRLKHCFGRGLLLYTDPVRLETKAVIRLRLEATD
jgi:phage-related protein